MTVTYTDETMRSAPMTEQPFVPRYAQGKRAKKGVRTWMILAPIGALVAVGGVAAVMMGGPAEDAAEPAAAPLASTPLAATPAPLESSLPSNAAITAESVVPAPVVREAPPAPPPAVQRRQPAPVAREAQPAPAPRAAQPEVTAPTTPQPYTSTLNTAPAPATPAPQTLSIETAPLN